MYRNILIATDGSELATKGLRHGVALARALGAAVTIVTVTEGWSAMELAREARAGVRDPIAEFERAASESALRILEGARKLAEEDGMIAETVHVPDKRPAEGIIRTAEDRKCDLIVMASHGRRGLQRLFLGSQALEVLTRSTVPALIVR
jgi:nucleotide-binding universal stress UspA family protein